MMDGGLMNKTLIRGGKDGKRMMKYYMKRIEEIEGFIRQHDGRITLLELEERFRPETLTIFFKLARVKVLVDGEVFLECGNHSLI